MNFNLNNLGNFNLNNNGNTGRKSGGLFGGIIIGIILLIAGTILLWWNEGNNVKNIQTVKEVTETAINVNSNSIDSKNEGKLICTSGNLEIVNEPIYDTLNPMAGIKTAKYTKVVEMYQWDEDEHESNNRTTYSYEKKWSEDKIDSTKFHQSGHDNIGTFPSRTESYYANDVRLGEFKLSGDQIKNFPTSATLTLNSNTPVPSGYRVYGNYITNTENPDNPNIGDIRISYKYNDYKEATVLAVQSGNTFTNFVSSSGKEVNRVESGILNSSQITNKMTDENNMLKWGLRLLGAVIIIIGYLAIVSPISKLASFVPILGNIVGTAVGLIAVLIGLVHSFVVIAIAWIRYRPVLGISLIAAAIALIVAIIVLIKKKKKQTA
ncbi:MAG: hypothetical protein J6M60_01075 [Clostridia bacterium]|nr:hypothetical protein [Clostridia bacterium]